MTAFPPALLSRVVPGALVVSGSRSFEGSMLQWVREAVCQVVDLATVRGWAIVVGDASGIDTFIIHRAFQRQVPTVILGCEQVGRLRVPLTVPMQEWAQSWLVPGGTRRSCFIIRDEALVSLALTTPHRGFYGIWDGESPGTQKTAGFARTRGVPGVLVSGAKRETWRAA